MVLGNLTQKQIVGLWDGRRLGGLDELLKMNHMVFETRCVIILGFRGPRAFMKDQKLYDYSASTGMSLLIQFKHDSPYSLRICTFKAPHKSLGFH